MGMRNEFRDMTERDIEEELDQRYVVVKCWKMGYDASDYYNKHLQYHHMWLDTESQHKQRACIQCIHDKVFPKFMTECGSRAELEWACGQTHIRVMCICENGRHKSVAVATALQAVYLKVGFNSLGPYHMSQAESWSDICQTCKDCRPNYHKEELITLLAHHYREFDATRTAARANPSR